MVDIIIGEKVVNKAKETGKIISFDDKYITVEYKNRTAKVQLNAFDLGILKYQNSDLQNKTSESVAQAKIEEERKAEEKLQAEVSQVIEEKAKIEELMQSMKSNTEANFEKISLRLEPAMINSRGVEEKAHKKIIREIFEECDNYTIEVCESFNPKMEYSKMTSRSRTRYTVGFLCEYLNTYVFRVFSREDTYKKRVRTGVTVLESDTTEIFRIIYINGQYYCFSKNFKCSYGQYRNTDEFFRWHISYGNSDVLLNEVIRLCDCKYLNDYISKQDINCYQYTKLLMPALYDNKAEIIFKKQLFSNTYYIDDIADYLAPFSSKQINFACENNVINTLPVIKSYGCYDVGILTHMERLMGNSGWRNTYKFMERIFEEHGFDYSDLGKKLIDFIKKVDRFDVNIYRDYVRMLDTYPGVMIEDFFDKNYIERHDEISKERQWLYYDSDLEINYTSVAKWLSWIDREENGYYIIVPKTIAEIRYEGENQHNCVYNAGYYDNVINRRSIIVFLREKKDVSYVTIEFDYKTFEVYQAFGKFNTEIDSELYEYIVDLGKRLNRERYNQ